MNKSQQKFNINENVINVDGKDVKFFTSQPLDPIKNSAKRNPIVLVHGTGGSTEIHFGYLFQLLASENRVISLDFSQPVKANETLTLEHLEKQVEAVIETAASGESVTLIGYSLGAVVTASVAAKRPDLVRNLVLIAGWVKTDSQLARFLSVWRQLYEIQSPSIADFMIFCAFSSPNHVNMLPDQLAIGFENAVPGEFEALQMDLNGRVDISQLVPTIKATTLIIGCTHDQMIPIRHSKDLFGAIQDARYTEIECGHAVIYERPSQLMQVIDQFCADPSFYPAGTIIPSDLP
ncbi:MULTISPECIES: alpha/beta fold hydrolase [Photorhabdus]|uniref:alpha/beta fold hydrolase n=1 Tax=Photorhabdus TaxID=29487 RepID=UPI000DCD99F3|nr:MULTISPECIES: alpha/beta hydrolase [Photorhabdus]MCT8344151.1 alpha/beta hydrolase [Photorhabdus kleinii]RAW96531.1 alpha/beta hydrolase [Photorhabdus sp. S10-54]RAW96731.1 alpha/beta hydrolase [Photorhabdus sp. S9-53]RAX01038.1 alpha/beta hydrolase [Photorhabdus sp. S8-52]